MTKRTRFAYPDFVLHEQAVTVLKEKGVPVLYSRPKDSEVFRRVKQIDIPRIVAGNDVAAMLYLKHRQRDRTLSYGTAKP